MAKLKALTYGPREATRELVNMGPRKYLSMANLAMGTLRYLMLNGKPDTLRFSAAKTLLDQPVIRGMLATLSPPGRHPGRKAIIHQHVHVNSLESKLQQLIAVLGPEAAQVIEAAVIPPENAPISEQTAANPLQTNEIR